MNSDFEIRKKMQIKQRRVKRKKILINFFIIFIIILIFLMGYIYGKIQKRGELVVEKTEESVNNEAIEVVELAEEEIKDWRLILVNKDNPVPEDYEFELASIDKNRKFDKRAIKQLNQMMDDIRKDGISNIWVQSSYRDIKLQEELYNNSVKKYMGQGKTEEEARKQTEIFINRPGVSEHNVGLAVDFNDVKANFENTRAFKWLVKNAENYGFILRYPKDKENITGISYEPWHWRFVGEENAKRMNEKNLCLEEYVKLNQKSDC